MAAPIKDSRYFLLKVEGKEGCEYIVIDVSTIMNYNTKITAADKDLVDSNRERTHARTHTRTHAHIYIHTNLHT